MSIDLDLLDAAVGADRHGEQQAAVELLLARRFRIVEVADPLDLEPPVLDIAREAVLLRASADELPLRAASGRRPCPSRSAPRAASLRACAASSRWPSARRSVGGASTGFGTAGGVGVLLICVSSSFVRRSSVDGLLRRDRDRRCSARPSACTGSGVFARRSASVLPPPSRWACARMSALVGLVCDFALTSATSSGGPRSNMLERSNGWNRIASSDGVERDRDAERPDDEPSGRDRATST